MLSKLLKDYRLRQNRKRYYSGAVLTRFIAKDIRREVKVLDTSEIDDGFITVKFRTWNVLYASKGIAAVPEFGTPKRVEIERLWVWTGPDWGGPVPKGESEGGA